MFMEGEIQDNFLFRKGGELCMFKKIIKKISLALGLLVVSTGVAFAAFSLTQTVSAGNTVTAASTALQITAAPINVSGLVVGGSTSPSTLTIKNISANNGNVALNLASVAGPVCPDLTLTVGGDATGSFSPIANASSVSLGALAPGATLNLTQVVSLSSSSAHLGQQCIWTETATFSN